MNYIVRLLVTLSEILRVSTNKIKTLKKVKSRDDMEKRLRAQLCIAVGMLIIGCIAFISGFWVHPIGVIDNSVLIGFGEILTFVGSLLGLDYNYKFKKHKIDKESDKDNS